MLRLPLATVAALAAVAATLACAEDGAPRVTTAPLADIAWSYRPAEDHGAGPQLRIARKGMNATLGRNDLPETIDRLAAALDTPGQAISFELAREAGTLACTGHAEQQRAAGTCRFVPDAGFVDGLARRGMQSDDPAQLLALAMVDAHLAAIDGLAGQGFRVEDLDTLTAIAALDVTPAYAVELTATGLAAGDIEDLVAARAVGVDGAWARGMAEAGYRDLALSKAIELRALDVTPDYARRMARVVRATEGAE